MPHKQQTSFLGASHELSQCLWEKPGLQSFLEGHEGMGLSELKR